MSSSIPRQAPAGAGGVDAGAASTAGMVRLMVQTADAGTEIYVIDGSFNLVGKGVSSFEALLDPGIYKVKVRAGFDTVERLVVLFEGREQWIESFPPLRFQTPIPLADTAQASPAHVAHAEAGARDVNLKVGEGSCIYVFARECGTGDGRGDAPTRAQPPHPARGLTLRDFRGGMVVDFSTHSTSSVGEPSAACCVVVAPGSYRLRVETPSGLSLERTIVASKGWQTQVFLTIEEDGAVSGLGSAQGAAQGGVSQAAERHVDLADASVLLSRSYSFKADDPALRETELARLGLTNGRKVVAEEMREKLKGEFEDPMLGLYGAHMLLLSAEPDLELVKKVVERLRKLLGGDHPDVEALALKLPGAAALGPSPAYVFDKPPMLRQSWVYVVEATGKRPELIPANSLSARIATRLWGEDPWLAWSVPPDAEEVQTPAADINPDVRESLKQVLKTHLRHVEKAAESAQRRIESIQSGGSGYAVSHGSEGGFGLSSLVALVRGLLGRVFSARRELKEKRVKAARAIKSAVADITSDEKGKGAGRRGAALDDEGLSKLVRAFGIPRANLEHLLDELRGDEDKAEDEEKAEDKDKAE